MRLPPRRDLKRQFWLLVRAGRLRTEAARELGLGERTGEQWFRQAGGVIPAYVQTQPGSRSLSLAEREEIFAGVERKESIRAIARSIGRASSTVKRELERNMGQQYRTRPSSELGPGSAGPGHGLGTTDRAWLSTGPRSRLPDPSQPSWPPTCPCVIWCRPN